MISDVVPFVSLVEMRVQISALEFASDVIAFDQILV